MIVQALAFYLFASVAVACGVMVISVRNPVHSVLYLILAFFSAAGLFVLQGAEFIAMLLVIVYVGAVAVLFLFVVMMLDINLQSLRRGFSGYIPVGLMVGGVLFAEILILVIARYVAPTLPDAAEVTTRTPSPATLTNTEALGHLIYTYYIYLFQGAGLILLVAMVGAIVLTLRTRKGVKRQKIADQNAITADQSVAVVKVEKGRGVSP